MRSGQNKLWGTENRERTNDSFFLNFEQWTPKFFHEKIRPKFEQISFFGDEKNGRKKGEKTLYLVNFY